MTVYVVIDLDARLDGRVPKEVEPFERRGAAVLKTKYCERGDYPTLRLEEVSGVSRSSDDQ